MRISHSQFSRTLMLCGLVVAVSLSGCAGVKDSMRLSQKDSVWNPVSQLREKKESKAEPSEPRSMVVTWKGAVYEQSVRGFGGRVYFYDKDNNSVEADGELIVYGFDESNKNQDKEKADKKFVFRSSEFQTHKSDSGFGTSYSIWCPWEKMGGYRKSITLVPIFVTKDKVVIKGGQSINVLGGRTPEKDLSENKPYKVLGSSPAVLSAEYESGQDSSNVELASFGGQPTEAQAKKRIKSSTINLTPNLSRRIQANTSAPASRESSPVITTNSKVVGSIHQQMRDRHMRERAEVAAEEAKSGEKKGSSATRPSPRVFGSPAPFN